jgi:hypothetical protein
VNETSQTQGRAKPLEPPASSRKSSRKSILALSMFAFCLNATAVVYTLSPSDFALPNVSGLVAELLPHEGASRPIPDVVVAVVNDLESAQQRIAAKLQDNESSLQQNAALLRDNGSSLQRNVALLEDNGSSLQRNTALLQGNESLLQQNNALLQQDATRLDTLRSSLTDEQSDVKTISAQLSTLIAKVDSLQNAMRPEITSSIPKGRARNRLSGFAHKRLARPMKPEGYISAGRAPLITAPASIRSPSHNPAG